MFFVLSSFLQTEEDKTKEDDEAQSQTSDWSSSAFGRGDFRSTGTMKKPCPFPSDQTLPTINVLQRLDLTSQREPKLKLCTKLSM
jgi:hypothetical protein